MPERRFAVYALLSLSLLLAACEQVGPSASAPGAGRYQVTGAPAQAAATGGGPSWALSASPTEDTNSPVKLAMSAAVAYAKSTMHATHPTVAEAKQDLFDPADPNSKVWIVHLVGDTFQLLACSPGTPQTTYARTCGGGTQARLGLRISDLSVEDAEVYGIETPVAQQPITLPPNAKLPTREIAIKTILGGIQGTDGGGPHLISADLILAGEDPQVNELPPDTPIWRITYDHGEYMFTGPPEAQEHMKNLHPVVTIWVDAITGLYHSELVDTSTPTP